MLLDEWRQRNRLTYKKLAKALGVSITTISNIILGNYLEDTGYIDVFAVSDNQDTEKILGTVFTVLVDFIGHFPDMYVYAIGSTEARTRLYQMGISKYWNYIKDILLVYGIRGNDLDIFEKDNRYDAFLFAKK